MERGSNFFEKLIINNNGWSAKSFVLVIGVIGVLLELLFLDILLIKGYNFDAIGFAGIITALGAFAASLMWGKTRREPFESADETDGGNNPSNTLYKGKTDGTDTKKNSSKERIYNQ